MPDPLVSAGRGVGPLTRRRFLQMLGAAGGSVAVMNGMNALGFMATSAQTEPPKLEGRASGQKVIVLGAGPGGCPTAYELMNLGYDVTVLEAHERLGGHAFTVRHGAKSHEYGGEEQTCEFDDDPSLWFDAGPSRIPYYHRAVLHYCKVLNIPMIDHKNLDLNSWIYAEDINGSLSGKKMRVREMQTDMGGYTAELLAKAINADKLDGLLTKEDRQIFIDYLVNWGFIDSKDLTYTGSENRGMAELPGAGDRPGKDSEPYSLQDLLPFAQATLNAQGGYLAATATLDWQTTLLKPRDGVGAIFTEGFAKALGDRVKLNSAVKEIRQTPDQVRIVYTDTTTGQDHEITGDYCVCNIPLSVLMKIPADFSPEMKTAIQSVPYAMSGRAGAQFKRRFWEEEDWIYGGQLFTNVPAIRIMDYPDNNYFAQKGIMLVYYNFGTAAATVSILSLKERMELAIKYGKKVHPTFEQDFENGFSVAWHRMPYSLGAWPTYTTTTRKQYYPRLLEPDGRIYLVGEHLSYVNAWMEGAFQAAWVQVPKLHERVMKGG